MSQKLKVGYKIVSSYNHHLYSLWLGTPGGGVRYRIGKLVKPKKHCGPLCVFESIEDAYAFLNSNSLVNVPYRFYKCIYTPSAQLAVWYRNRGLKIMQSRFPCGTRLATGVKLLEKI